jgi:hypothetical protein
VPILLSQDQKDQHVENCSAFVAAVHRHSLVMLDNIILDVTMFSYYTPETKKTV